MINFVYQTNLQGPTALLDWVQNFSVTFRKLCHISQMHANPKNQSFGFKLIIHSIKYTSCNIVIIYTFCCLAIQTFNYQ